MKIFSFEKLNVWQKSRELSLVVYEITQSFLEEEHFGLISQMRRCAVSVSSNIAEGSGRNSGKDKARFTEIAYGSGLELLNQAILSLDLKFLSEEKFMNIRTRISEITAMLNALQKAQLKL